MQSFGEDVMPLVLLFAISVTGLMLVVSYEWMHGYGYEFLAILHAAVVIVTLVWLPFGKFFHIFQRPAQLGVSFYKDAGARGEQACCARCGLAYASKMHVEDLIAVERLLGYQYETPGTRVDHYQRICPRCRRIMPALVQDRLWRGGLAADELRDDADASVRILRCEIHRWHNSRLPPKRLSRPSALTWRFPAGRDWIGESRPMGS
jgi:hypothetical protein